MYLQGIEEMETHLAELVEKKQLYLTIDRSTGVVTFERPRNAAEVLNEWSDDIKYTYKQVDVSAHLRISSKNLKKLLKCSNHTII